MPIYSTAGQVSYRFWPPGFQPGVWRDMKKGWSLLYVIYASKELARESPSPPVQWSSGMECWNASFYIHFLSTQRAFSRSGCKSSHTHTHTHTHTPAPLPSRQHLAWGPRNRGFQGMSLRAQGMPSWALQLFILPAIKAGSEQTHPCDRCGSRLWPRSSLLCVL